MNTEVLLKVSDLKKHYALGGFWKPKQIVKALDGVTFEVQCGETLAIVGESGCGKSTLAKVLLQIEDSTTGEVKFSGQIASQMKREESIRFVQMIFQDPYSSINPRKKAWQIISEPLKINLSLSDHECRARAIEMMETVGLRPEFADRYPHMFSGGQRQRIGIARALMLKPKLLLCDEPVSALDVSIQAQVLNLLMDLQDEMKLTYIFISHDLSIVRHIADRVMVMYLGKVVELGTRDQIFGSPQHPYTQALLASRPADITSSEKQTDFPFIQGELPSPLDPPPGCSFHKRCFFATERCSREVPSLRMVREREVSCHFAGSEG